MNFKTRTVPLLAATALAAGLTVGALLPSPGTPVTTPPSASHCQEDDPCWDCHTMGNMICGDPNGVHVDAAWKLWDKTGGASKLKVDPGRAFRVGYVGTADTYPKLAEYDLALPGTDGLWYVFRAEYTKP